MTFLYYNKQKCAQRRRKNGRGKINNVVIYKAQSSVFFGDLAAKQAGSVGGQMVKKMVESYENSMSNKG